VKTSGLGDQFWVGGNDLSGDTSNLSKISGSQATIDVTAINVAAFQRLGGLWDGQIAWISYFNPTGAHPVLSALPTTDTLTTYVANAGSTTAVIGNWAACMQALLLDYAPTRAVGGALNVAVTADADEYGLEWGQLLTAGIRTDTAATLGTGLDGGASTAFGAQAYLHVFGFTGTDATVKLQDSADNVTFTDIASGAFAQTTGGPGWQRIALSNAATVRRYVRATTVTTGGFTNLQFGVVLVRNPIAGKTF
jgi:hypothetical protein